MAKKPHDRISALITEMESIAKRLRGDVRKAARSSGLERQIRSAARDLQKRAAHVAAQAEKYVHQLRVELEGKKKTAKRSSKKSTTKRTTRRKTAKTSG